MYCMRTIQLCFQAQFFKLFLQSLNKQRNNKLKYANARMP